MDVFCSVHATPVSAVIISMQLLETSSSVKRINVQNVKVFGFVCAAMLKLHFYCRDMHTSRSDNIVMLLPNTEGTLSWQLFYLDHINVTLSIRTEKQTHNVARLRYRYIN